MTYPSWVASWAWLSFIELDKAVVLVWLDWLVSVIMVSVCLSSDALLQHLPSYLGFSYLGREVSLHSCSYLGRGVSPHHRPSWLWCGIAPLGPPAPAQPPFLGLGVAPLSFRPWPRTWGSSSRLFLRHHSLALSATALDLGHELTPLGHRPSGMGSPSFCPWPRT